MNLAPNGKPSNLTPEQYSLVRTRAFKTWFGDWENSPETASKANTTFDANNPDIRYKNGGKIFSLNNPEYKDAFLDRGDEDKETWKDYGKQSIKFIIDEIKELEFPLTIYRGVKEKYSENPSEFVENRSWTTDIYVAKRFSGGLGSVVSKIIDSNDIDYESTIKKRILYSSQDEYEIILNEKGEKIKPKVIQESKFYNGEQIEKYKDYEIVIVEEGSYVQAIITQNGNHIGMITLDDFPNEPYVNYSGIKDEHRGQGLGSYVYQLLDDYSLKKTGKHITHGTISASISAIRLWRKRLKDPNYLPDDFYDYWEDDAEEVLKELNSGNKYELGGELTLTSEQVEQKLGRKLHWWNDDVVTINGTEYKKVFLKPEYKIK